MLLLTSHTSNEHETGPGTVDNYCAPETHCAAAGWMFRIWFGTKPSMDNVCQNNHLRVQNPYLVYGVKTVRARFDPMIWLVVCAVDAAHDDKCHSVHRKPSLVKKLLNECEDHAKVNYSNVI